MTCGVAVASGRATFGCWTRPIVADDDGGGGGVRAPLESSRPGCHPEPCASTCFSALQQPVMVLASALLLQL